MTKDIVCINLRVGQDRQFKQGYSTPGTRITRVSPEVLFLTDGDLVEKHGTANDRKEYAKLATGMTHELARKINSILLRLAEKHIRTTCGKDIVVVVSESIWGSPYFDEASGAGYVGQVLKDLQTIEVWVARNDEQFELVA